VMIFRPYAQLQEASHPIGTPSLPHPRTLILLLYQIIRIFWSKWISKNGTWKVNRVPPRQPLVYSQL